MKNGSPINWVAFVQDSSNGAFGGRVIHLSASDAVTVQTYQQSGGNLDLNGGSEDECFFGGFKLITWAHWKLTPYKRERALAR